MTDYLVPESFSDQLLAKREAETEALRHLTKLLQTPLPDPKASHLRIEGNRWAARRWLKKHPGEERT